MGNIFYKLLTNERKYNDLPLKVAQEKIKRKQLPPLNSYLEASNFGIHVALKNAIAMTLQRYPQERKSAKEVYEYLAKELSKYEENTRGTNSN